jgi:hypothetical protein
VAGYWIKLHIARLDDYRVATLPDSSWRRYIEALLLAKDVNEAGYLPVESAAAFRLRIPVQTLRDDLSRLALAGLVELRLHPDGDDRWYVTDFATTQVAESPTERKRQQRARNVTNVSRNVTQNKSKRQNKNKKQNRAEADQMGESAAAAASEFQILLRQYGIAWNQTTQRLARCDWVTADYIAAHLKTARRRGEGMGLVITRMLAGEDPPGRAGNDAVATAELSPWDTLQQAIERHGLEQPAQLLAALDPLSRAAVEAIGLDDLPDVDEDMFTSQREYAAQVARHANGNGGRRRQR